MRNVLVLQDDTKTPGIRMRVTALARLHPPPLLSSHQFVAVTLVLFGFEDPQCAILAACCTPAQTAVLHTGQVGVQLRCSEPRSVAASKAEHTHRHTDTYAHTQHRHTHTQTHTHTQHNTAQRSTTLQPLCTGSTNRAYRSRRCRQRRGMHRPTPCGCQLCAQTARYPLEGQTPRPCVSTQRRTFHSQRQRAGSADPSPTASQTNRWLC